MPEVRLQVPIAYEDRLDVSPLPESREEKARNEEARNLEVAEMNWHYALAEGEDGFLGVHEVYVSDGRFVAVTETPAYLGDFASPEDALAELEWIIRDITFHKPVKLSDFDPLSEETIEP